MAIRVVMEYDLRTCMWIIKEEANGDRRVAKPVGSVFAPIELGGAIKPTLEFNSKPPSITWVICNG